LNALVGAMREELLAGIRRHVDDDSVRVLVLTGQGRGFCAGGDLDRLLELRRNEDTAELSRLLGWGHQVITAITDCPKPVLASINGATAGAGLALALACDVRLMARGAEIGFPEIRLGFFPGAGGTQRLTRLLGPARALRLMMEGRRLGADEAHALGLVEEVVPADLLQQTARDVAERLAAGPTRAIGLLKRCVYQGYGRPLDEGLAIEAEAVWELIRTSDAREGMAAFLAKRPPRFTGA